MKLSLRKSKSRGVMASDLEEKGVGGREIRVLFDQGRSQTIDGTDPGTGNRRSSTEPVLRRKSSAGTADRISLSERLQRRISRADDANDPLVNDTKHIQIIDEAGSVPSESSAGDPSVVKEGSRSDDADNAIVDDEADEVTPDAETGRPAGDIKFAALPVPRKDSQFEHNRRSSFASHDNTTGALRSRPSDTPFRSLGSTLLEFGQRTMTLDGPTNTRVHHRRPSNASRFAGRSTTLERTISNAFRRRRDSTSSQRPRDDVALPYISFQPTIGRNSAFTSLTHEQRAELGGIEYRATKTLCWVLVLYYFGFHLFGFICYISFIFTANSYVPLIASIGVSRGWWSVFTSASAFNDLGLTLNPDSFVSFQNAVFLLLASSLLIVAGNTGFPCVLRFVIWVAHELVPNNSPLHEELAFLLDHPRRCFTLLFPSAATWWLLAILVVLNGLDLILFIVLDLHDPVISAIPVGYRIVDGLFQAFCTRTAGFTVVNLAGLHSAILVSYLIMMYISVFPVAISIRRTNVYEERSLGIYSAEDEEDNGKQSFVGTHIRRQLGFDLWYVFLALFIICIIENPVSLHCKIIS